MKKFYLPLLAAGLCCFSILACHTPGKKTGGFGDADAVGSDEDAFERMTYEWMMLRDPATGRIPEHIREKELAYAVTLPHDMNNPQAKSAGVATWSSRGPWNVGGRTRAFAIDVSNENNLIAGTPSGGMWRSTDGGLSWTMTTPVSQYPSVSCLTQDTRTGHTATWYYGTGEAYGASAGTTGAYYYGNGIYKSTDSGVTWALLPATGGASITSFDNWADIVWNIAINPATSQDIIYVAAYGSIYKSADGGASWNSVLGSGSYYTDIAVSPTGVIYASLSSDGTSKGIFRSTDGLTFTNITPAGFPSSYNRIRIGISPANENQVYFLGNTPGFGYPDTTFTGDIDWNSLWRYTYISGNGSGAGGSWQDRSQNLPHTGGQFDKFQSQGSYDLVVKGNPNDTNTLFIGGTNLYRSTSAFADDTHTTFIGGYVPGATLPVVNSYPDHHPDQHELAFMPSNPNIMISANDGGLFKTGDNTATNVTWTPLNNGYLTSMFYTCAIDHAGTNDIIIGGAQDNGSWFTNSASATTPWVTPRGGDGSYCAIADSGLAYYFSIQNGKIMRAKLNASGGVDSFARIDPIGGSGYLFINPFVLDPNNSNIMYMAGGRVLWRNDNLSGIPYAGNWDSISTNWVRFPDTAATAGAKITAIAVSKTPANRVYYGTSTRRMFRIDNANVGTPKATEITQFFGNDQFPPGANISSIAVDPNNGDNVMVSFSNYNVYSIFYSNDGGASWKRVAGNLEEHTDGTGSGPSIRWVRILPLATGTVYLAGTSVGLFAAKELDSTATIWTQQGTGTIGNAVVDMIDSRSTDGLVTIATHSRGIFSAKIQVPNDVSVHTPMAAGFQYKAYPNPFRGTASLQFKLSSKEYVSLQVYDEVGRPVRTLVNGEVAAGDHLYSLQGDRLPAGIYFCTLKIGAFVDTRRLLKIE